jgi:hypothetical protein
MLPRNHLYAVLLVILVAFLVSGCVTNTPLPGPGDGRSVFVHPRTGEIKHCEKPSFMTGAGGLIPESRYADCKTEAEEQVFVRKSEEK